MLDDDQLDFLTMDFTKDWTAATGNSKGNNNNTSHDGNTTADEVGLYSAASLPPGFPRRGDWSRMSLPSNFSRLEEFLREAKRFSDEFQPRSFSQDSQEEEREEKEEEGDNVRDDDDDGGMEESPTGFDRTLQFDSIDDLRQGDEAENLENSDRDGGGGGGGVEYSGQDTLTERRNIDSENCAGSHENKGQSSPANASEGDKAVPKSAGDSEKQGCGFENADSENADNNDGVVAAETVDVHL
jgi:hypothetical protein